MPMTAERLSRFFISEALTGAKHSRGRLGTRESLSRFFISEALTGCSLIPATQQS